MKVYHSRFKNNKQMYYVAVASAVCVASIYWAPYWFGERMEWHNYLMFAIFTINAFIPCLMIRRERAELDEEAGELRVKPGKRRIAVADVWAVKVKFSHRGNYRHITVRIGQYDFQRLYTADYEELIADLQRLNPKITVDRDE